MGRMRLIARPTQIRWRLEDTRNIPDTRHEKQGRVAILSGDADSTNIKGRTRRPGSGPTHRVERRESGMRLPDGHPSAAVRQAASGCRCYTQDHLLFKTGFPLRSAGVQPRTVQGSSLAAPRSRGPKRPTLRVPPWVDRETIDPRQARINRPIDSGIRIRARPRTGPKQPCARSQSRVRRLRAIPCNSTPGSGRVLPTRFLVSAGESWPDSQEPSRAPAVPEIKKRALRPGKRRRAPMSYRSLGRDWLRRRSGGPLPGVGRPGPRRPSGRSGSRDGPPRRWSKIGPNQSTGRATSAARQ